jgi:hypothetical protein
VCKRVSNVGLANILSLSCERAFGRVGSNKKKLFKKIKKLKINLYNLPETKGQHNKNFPKCPKKDFSRGPKMFGHKWKISSTLIRCPKLSGPIKKFPKCPKLFEHEKSSRVPKFFWADI